MENVITKNNVKPILDYKEKNRFHQISGQFFKGSFDFFVEQQEKTQKFIDDKLKNSSFYEHYQDAIQNVKDNIGNKIDEIKNNVKNNFHQKLMDFIILFEIGVIAATQCPLKLEGVSKFIEDTKNELSLWRQILGTGWDGVLYVMEQCGQKLDFQAIIDSSIGGIKILMKSAINMFAEGINYFFNNLEDNAFLICLGECAAKVGETASGAVGIILDLVMAAANRSVANRPDLTHFLKYGTNQYMIASQIEKDAHQIVGIHEQLSFSSNEIGYSWNGIWQGVVNENDDDDKDELDDAKRVLNQIRELRVQASKESADTYSSGHYHSGSSILNTSSYQAMVKKWEEESNVAYDLSGTSTQYMGHLYLNEKNADVSFLKSQKPVIKKFYDTYKDSDNPVAKKICEEIEKWLFVKLPYGTELMGQRLRGYWLVRLFVFAPAIVYAIIEFEHMQKMTREMYEQQDLQLYKRELALLIDKETETVSELNDAIRSYDIGVHNTVDFIKKLNEIFLKSQDKEYSFEILKRLRPDVVFTSFKYLPQMVNLIKFGMGKVQNIKDINRELFRGSATYYNLNSEGVTNDQGGLATDDKKTFVWRSKTQMIETISTNHTRKKKQIERLFLQRAVLWEIMLQLVNEINDKKMYAEVADKIKHI